MAKRVRKVGGNPEDLLDTVQVGRLLRCSRFTVGRLLRLYPEYGVRLGANGRWFVRRGDVERLRDVREVQYER